MLCLQVDGPITGMAYKRREIISGSLRLYMAGFPPGDFFSREATFDC